MHNFTEARYGPYDGRGLQIGVHVEVTISGLEAQLKGLFSKNSK